MTRKQDCIISGHAITTQKLGDSLVRIPLGLGVEILIYMNMFLIIQLILLILMDYLLKGVNVQ